MPTRGKPPSATTLSPPMLTLCCS